MAFIARSNTLNAINSPKRSFHLLARPSSTSFRQEDAWTKESDWNQGFIFRKRDKTLEDAGICTSCRRSNTTNMPTQPWT